MKKTTAPLTTPSPANSSIGNDKVGKSGSPSRVFVGMALDMSWRLAIVVLVPVIGGYQLDRTLNTSPALVIVGFVIAMAGTGLVLWQTMQGANKAVTKGGK